MTVDNVLPHNWVRARLGDIIEPSREKVNPQRMANVPYIGLEHIEKETGRLFGYGHSDEVRSTKAVFHTGDLLYGKLRPYLNKVFVPDFDGICSTDILVFPKSPNINNRLLFYRFMSGDFVRYASRNVSGVQHPRVSPTTLADFEIVMPPLAEQKRIVTKIEELFTQLDAGIEELKQVKAQLKCYRQSVLKAAVEGDLTCEWCENHKDQIEPASKLLEHILTEHSARWEKEELAKMRAKGKDPKDDKWKDNYKEPTPTDTNGLTELPDGWVWVTFPQIGELNRGKSKHRPRNDPKLYGGPYPFVQTGDIRHANGTLREYSQTYSEEGLSQSRFWSKGTLCITIAANIADTAILGFDACFPDSVVGFLATSKHCNVKYIELFLRTAKADLERYAPATAQKNINLRTLRELAIPFPTLEEQKQIVVKVERRLSVADEIEKELDQALTHAERLRQSILKRAFEGKLVKQCSGDRSVRELLKRI